MAERAVATTKKPETKQKCSSSCKQKSDFHSSGSSADRILQLQRTEGNHAVQRLIKSGVLQAKLRVGQPNDIYEQEADRVAEQVMSMPEPQAVSSGTLSIQRTCPRCEEEKPRRQPIEEEDEKEELLQTKEISWQNVGTAPDLESRISAIRGGGQPLAESERAFFEPRFKYDFSKVRVHTDSKAAESARAVNARAFTVGKDVVFGVGEYTPGIGNGQRLLAHELTHVVQQRGGDAMVQCEPKKEKASKAKIDVSIVLNDSKQDFYEGRAYAKTVIRVTDEVDAAAKLKALGAPIRTLYVVSHSITGQVQFTSSIGTISWVSIDDLGNALKKAAMIDTVDFRGCKIGEDVGAMESFNKNVGSQSTKGTNCWILVQQLTPLYFQGAEVTSPSQIPKKMQSTFDKTLLENIAGMVTDNKKSVKDCLVGLAAGEKAGQRTLAKIWQLYWANQGNLIASWASPNYNKKWQKGSICTKDMTTKTKPCRLIVIKAPAAGAK